MSNPPEPCPCFKYDMFPSDSQLRSFHDSLHGESRICCLRHHRENGNSNTTTNQHDKNNSITSERQETHTLIHPGYRVTSPKHWKLSWMLHDCKDWSFQDTTTRNLVQKGNCLFHSAALPINPFARTAKSWSNPRRCRVNLELKWNQLFSQPMQISVGS